MLKPKPYFLENKEWYYHDDKINKFFLTDKAPEEARKSYEEFYEYHFDFFDYGILLEVKENIYKEEIEKGKTPEEAKKISDDWWEWLMKGEKE